MTNDLTKIMLEIRELRRDYKKSPKEFDVLVKSKIESLNIIPEEKKNLYCYVKGLKHGYQNNY